MIESLLTTVDLINTNLDRSPHSWHDQLPAIQNITFSFEVNDTAPDEARRHWQVPLISVFQRVAFVNADTGAVKDLADWCLRQSLVLLQIYPDDVEILTRESVQMTPGNADCCSNWPQLVTASAEGSFEHFPSAEDVFEQRYKLFWFNIKVLGRS